MKKPISLLPVFSALAGTLHAQTDTATIERLSLKELLNVKVVTATKVSQGLETAPATVRVISREQIRLRGYQSVLDVLYDLPGFKVDDKTAPGLRNIITVRGKVGSERLVILLDGVSISSPSGEAMPVMENYPVNLAEQIEVVYGPASALYGANAVSGVINIITKKGAKKNLALEASALGGSYGYSNTSLFLTKKLGEDCSLVVSGQYGYDKGVDNSRYYKNDPQYSISGYAKGTLSTIYGNYTPQAKIKNGYEAPLQGWNVYAALRSSRVDLSFFQNSATVPTAYGNNTHNAVYNKEVFMRQNIAVASAVYKLALRKLNANTSLTVSQYNLDPQSNYRNLYTALEPAYKYATTMQYRLEEQVDYHPAKNTDLSAGLSYENYSGVPQSADLAAPVAAADFLHASYAGTAAFYRPEGLPAQFYFIRYYNAGSYAQLRFSPGERWHFTLGARYDYNSRYGHTFNPRLGLVYQPAAKTTLKFLYGEAYKAPTPSDAYAQWGSFFTADSGRSYSAPFLHLPNPHLNPVTTRTMEINLSQELTDNLVLTGCGFYSAFKGVFDYSDDNATGHLYKNNLNGIPVGYVEIFTNNNREKIYGGSLQLAWRYGFGKQSLTSYAAVSYVDGKVETRLNEKAETAPDRELDFISHWMVRIGADAHLGRFGFSPRLLLVTRQHVQGLLDTTGRVWERQQLPGYALLNASLRYQAGKRLSVFFNVSNALNQHYRAVGFNMDLQKPETELFYGSRQDPIRMAGGVQLSF